MRALVCCSSAHTWHSVASCFMAVYVCRYSDTFNALLTSALNQCAGLHEQPSTVNPMCERKLHVTCIGAGYVGGPTMAVIAKRCPDVNVVICDISDSVIKAWQSPELPVKEAGLQDLVTQVRGKNLFFTTDLVRPVLEADIIFVCVDTPPKSCGDKAGYASDTCNFERAIRGIASATKAAGGAGTGRKTVVVKSTVPVGTWRIVRAIFNANGLEHSIVSNPEFLAEGTAVADLLDPSRVLVGSECSKAASQVADLYARWVPRDRIILTDTTSSEMSKLVANALLAQRISSINCASILCERVGADVGHVARAVGADPRIGKAFLRASVGFGGSCFRKDVLNLAHVCRSASLPELGDYWESIVQMNEFQKERFVCTMSTHMFGSLRGKRVAVLGFAFKKNTADARETAAAYVVRRLLQERATVVVYDPMVPESTVRAEVGGDEGASPLLTVAATAAEAANAAHAVAILTEWDEFRYPSEDASCAVDYPSLYRAMTKPAFIFDGRRVTNAEMLRKIGFVAYSVGSAAT